MNNMMVDVRLFGKLIIFLLIFFIAFSQSDFIIPKVDLIILFLAFLSLPIVKLYKTIIFSKILFFYVICLIWRFFSYIRSPFFGDITVLSIPVTTFVALVVCFLLVPFVFKDIKEFISFYKKNMLFILIIMSLIHLIVPDLLEAAGADKGLSLGFWHPNVLALYLSIFIFLCAFDIIIKNKYFYNLIFILVATYILYLTNSRGGYILTGFAYLIFLLYFISKLNLLKILFVNRYSVFLYIFILVFYIKILYDEYGFFYFDLISSGRLSIFNIAIDDVGDNYWLGLGILPRAFMYGFDSQKLGAGLDGVYSVVFYNEGLIGLFLLIILHIFFIREGLKQKDYLIKFIYFSFLISVLIHGFFEAHYWQRLSPATFVVFSMVALILKKRSI